MEYNIFIFFIYMDINIDKKYIYLLNLVLVYFVYINFDIDIYKCSSLTHIFAIICGLLCMYYNCNITVFIIGASFFNFHSIHQILQQNKNN